MTRDEIIGTILHNVSPVVGRIRYYEATGNSEAAKAELAKFQAAVEKAADAILSEK